MRTLAILALFSLSAIGCTRAQSRTVSDALSTACDVAVGDHRETLTGTSPRRLLEMAKETCEHPRLARHEICKDVNDHRAVGIGIETFLLLTKLACTVVGEEAIAGVMQRQANE